MEFNKQHFDELLDILTDDKPCITLLIPTHQAGHVPEDKIRLKNALSEAREKLSSEDALLNPRLSPQEIDAMLQPAYDLLESNQFLLHLSHGLAIFIQPGFFQYFIVPIDFDPLVYVSNHFYLRHLLPLIKVDDRFFLLALSRDEVRFFEGHRHSITPVKIEDLVPAGMEEVFAIEVREKSLQWHPEAPKGTRRPESAGYHGHGLDKDRTEEDLEIYLRAVDDGLMKMLYDEKAPLIIAAVEEIPPVYRRISNYKYIVEPYVKGNPELDDPVLLHEKAWEQMRPLSDRQLEAGKEAFGNFFAEGKASFDIKEVVAAAINGRVDTLYLDKNERILWGTHVLADNSVEIFDSQKPYATDLYNKAAIETYRNGGTVFNLDRADMPRSGTAVNAVMRY